MPQTPPSGNTIQPGLRFLRSRTRIPFGSKIAGLAAAIAVVGFFLPWITVSCNATPILTMSGHQIAKGGVLQTVMGSSDPMPGHPLLFVTLGAACLICLLVFVAYLRHRLGIVTTLIQMCLATSGLLSLLLVLNQLMNEYTFEGESGRIGIRTEYGLWMAVLGLVGVLVGGVFALWEILRHGAKSLRKTVNS